MDLVQTRLVRESEAPYLIVLKSMSAHASLACEETYDLLWQLRLEQAPQLRGLDVQHPTRIHSLRVVVVVVMELLLKKLC